VQFVSRFAQATASHGSSLEHGSLSNQVEELRVILPNLTTKTFTTKDGALFNAFRASAGRLGFVTEVTLPIVPDQAVNKMVAEGETQEILPPLDSAEARKREVALSMIALR